MTLESYQCGGGRIPARAFDALQGVRMKPGLLGETFFGYAGELEMRANALDAADNHAQAESTFQCVSQADNHIRMGCRGGIRRRMDKTPEQRREIFRAFQQASGLRTAAWAKQSGVAANSIYNFLNGHSDALDPRTYAKLARTAGVPAWRLSGDAPEAPSPTSVWVCGHVEAGSFRSAVEWDRSLWYAVDVPVPQRFQKMAKALEVRGPSMNLEYKEGSVVIWVDMLDARPPRHEDHVIVYAYSHDDEIEATVKELRIVGGQRWLWPKSDHPEHQAPLNPNEPGDHVSRVEIVGLVVGDYRQRIT